MNKTLKKTLSIIVAILMIVTSVPFAFAAEDLTDDITSVTLKDTDNDGYYEIATADELKAFANLVNAGNVDINAELTADIILNENVITEDGQLSDNSESFEVWVPIGNSDVKYTGVFDGARHVISGLYYKGNGEYAGLFGAIDGKYQDKSVGAIRDLYLIDSYFDIESSDRWFRVGGLAGYSYYAHFDNCYVEAQFNLRSTYHAASIYLGGISGMTYSTAENCFSDLAVSITKDKNASAPWVGGIYGNGSSTAVIINCHTNYDTVSTGNPQITNSTASRTAEEFENGTLCSLVGFHPCESTEGKKATCTEAGWKSQYCTACDYTESHSEIPATGHTLTSVKAKTPTCTEAGYEAYEYCTVCDYTTYKEIPAVNHKDTLIQVVGKDVTCTEVGYAAYEYCTACDYTTYEEIPALGHVFSTSGICDVCGEVCVHESIVEGKCDDCGAEIEVVTITMTDSWGDGWNGNAIAIEKLIDGVYTEVARATFEDGDTATYNAFLDKDGSYVFKWIQGSYSNECSFVINVDGEDVYEVTSASGLTNGQEFYRICEHKTFTDGKCDCGYECPHAGQTDTCTICGKIIHTHNYEYTASGNTITATCTASGTCDAPDGAYLKLVVPTKYSWKQYSATAKEIEVENTIADISYEVDYCCDGGCINAGSHTASVTLGGATATVGFEIEKYYVSQASLIMSTRTKVYDGTTDAPGEINALKFYMATGSEIINLPADGYQATVRYETPEVGDRKVIWQWVKVTDKEAMKNYRFGYNDFENGLNSDFSITKRPITVTPEANEVLIGNQPNAGNKVIVGGDYGLADNQTITVTYQHIDSSAVGEKELIIDTVTILDANGNDVTSNYEITTVNGICDVVECPHETYTDGVCDICGYECPHEDITVYGWDYCYTCGYIVAEEIALNTPHTVTERHFVKFTPEVSGSYYFWSYDTTDGADPEGCVYEESIFNYLDFIGSNNNFLYGNPAYNEITFEAELTAGKTYYFELFEYRKTQNSEPFEYTVMIKKICDNGAHNFTDSICDVCGYECFHPVATEGVCDNCGSACTHNKQNKEITVRPVQNDDGTWEKGTVEITCLVCGNTETKEVERDHEGYKTFDETAAKLEALINSDELIDSPKNSFAAALNNLKNSAYSQVYTEIEGAIPSMTDGLNSIIATIEAGLANGTMKKADWTFMTAILDEIKALIDNDPNKIIPSMVGYYYGPNGFYSGSFGNPNYPQSDYDRVMAEYGFKNQLETLLAGLKDGTALKADYTEIDEAIADIDEKLNDADLTDEAKTELEDIKAQLKEMKKNPLASKADVEELMDAVEELDEAIEDGTVVIAEGSVILEAYDAECGRIMSEKYGEEAINRIVSIMMQNKNEELVELYAYADTITGTIAENADKIEELKRKMDALYAAIERCIIGTHTVEEYAITSSAKCGVNAVETGICYYCVETVTREVENSALTHSFTKYEVTEEAKCGVEGKKVAACDNGCGETDEKEIEALRHSFTKYEVTEEAKCGVEGKEVAYCDNGCGETDEKAIEALRHSFTKYEVTEEAKCGIEGKKVAVCDHGCGATDEKAIEALEHLFLDYIYNEDATCTADGTKTAECIYGCGETDTVTAEDTMLDHADEDGDMICDDCEEEIVDACPICGGKAHEGPYGEYICMLITLIKLVVALINALGVIA